ncbi:MAG: DUF2334 domain-containing protein, partial [Candidatus Eremiobacteraeota bacterium]|nr:DUF2334 domain-containing protein [Candidatus Eremiobacteraeota bacterium]
RAMQSGGSGALVLYDTAGQWGWLGELYAMGVANLAGHFGAVKTEPISSYTSGQMSSYAAAIYVGSTYYCCGVADAIPSAFYNDVAAGKARVLWMNDNIWNMANAIGVANFKNEYGWDPTSSYFAPGGSIGNVTQVQYKNTLGRNANLTRTMPAGTDGGILHPNIVNNNAVTQLAIAGGQNQQNFPWAIRSGNLTYIGEIPFQYVNESDRILVLEDLLFDALAPATTERHRAMVRLEEIDACTDPVNLQSIATYLGQQNIPYGFNLIPLFEDPRGAYDAGVPQTISFTPPNSGSSGGVTSTNIVNFNAGTIPAGDSLWISAVMKVGGLDKNQKDVLYVENSKVTVDGQTFVGPNMQITFDPNATSASLNYSSTGNLWTEVLPENTSGNDFLTGVIIPGPFPGAQGASWTASFSTQSSHPLQLNVNWQFAAALYASLGSNYNALGVKPLDDNNYSWTIGTTTFPKGNSDHAGVPESMKSAFIGGAGTGGGGSNFTGSYSGTVNFTPSNSGAQPPPSSCPNAQQLVPVINYMLAHGGVMVDDGYTHQYSNLPNPYDGVTGEDAEFFLASLASNGTVSWNSPIPGDSTSWAEGRVQSADAAFTAAGWPTPQLWSTPNYFASDVDYKAFASAGVKARYERSVYFSGDLAGGQVNYSRWLGEFYPYVVHDVYGTEVLPENLGGFVPIAGLDSPLNTGDMIVNNAQANMVVRDGFASFFFDPLYGTSNDLQHIVDGIKGQYTFVAPSPSLQ